MGTSGQLHAQFIETTTLFKNQTVLQTGREGAELLKAMLMPPEVSCRQCLRHLPFIVCLCRWCGEGVVRLGLSGADPTATHPSAERDAHALVRLMQAVGSKEKGQNG